MLVLVLRDILQLSVLRLLRLVLIHDHGVRSGSGPGARNGCGAASERRLVVGVDVHGTRAAAVVHDAGRLAMADAALGRAVE